MKTRELVTIGILTALSVVIMLIEIPNPLVPFLKFDLSDVVVLVVLLAYGWKTATITVLLRGLLHAWIKGPDPYSAIPYLGNMTAVLASLTIILAFVVARKVLKSKDLVTGIIAVLALTVVLTVLNYFIITPAYFGWPTVSFVDVQASFSGFVAWDTSGRFDATSGYLMAVLFAYVPFNIIKGTMITVAYFLLEKRVSKVLIER